MRFCRRLAYQRQATTLLLMVTAISDVEGVGFLIRPA
jgi:hypothetical protein